MSLNLINKRFNIKQNEYLLDCDSINKYSIKSIYKKPKIEKVSISFPLNTFSSISSVDSNLQVKSMLIFYTLFSLISYINFKKIKLKKSVSDANFSLKILLSSKESIYFFFFNLIVENADKIEKNDVEFFTRSMPLNCKKNSTQHNILVPAKLFGDIDDFFSKHVRDIDLNAFNLSINLIIKNFNKCKDKKKLIQNIAFFWMSK
jgi:hypothetical protein